jgi:hypothetical protein
MFNIPVILFTPNHMFRPAKIIIRWFMNTYVVTEFSKWIHFFIFTNNIMI